MDRASSFHGMGTSHLPGPHEELLCWCQAGYQAVAVQDAPAGVLNQIECFREIAHHSVIRMSQSPQR